MAEAAGAWRVRSRAGRAALSGSRSFPTSGRGHLGTALECGTASMGGTPKTSHRVSASRSTCRYPGAEGKDSRPGQRFAALMARSHHTGERPQADVTAAHQGYYGREAVPSETARGSPAMAGRRLE